MKMPKNATAVGSPGNAMQCIIGLKENWYWTFSNPLELPLLYYSVRGVGMIRLLLKMIDLYRGVMLYITYLK